MNKKQAKNLYKCVIALEQSPNPRKFDMSTYVHDIYDDKFDDCPDLYNCNTIQEYKEQLKSHLAAVESYNWCATPACVFGHFASRGDLQKVVKICESNPVDHYVGNKNGGVVDYDDEIILEYFGITMDESYDLFSSEGCDNAQTVKQAILYIKNFLKQKGYDWKKLASDYA